MEGREDSGGVAPPRRRGLRRGREDFGGVAEAGSDLEGGLWKRHTRLHHPLHKISRHHQMRTPLAPVLLGRAQTGMGAHSKGEGGFGLPRCFNSFTDELVTVVFLVALLEIEASGRHAVETHAAIGVHNLIGLDNHDVECFGPGHLRELGQRGPSHL